MSDNGFTKMNNTNTKQLSTPQRAKIAAQCDAVQSAAAALSFQWPTIKSYCGWAARYGAWLCLHAEPDRHAAQPALKIRAFLQHVARGQDNGRPKSATSLNQALRLLPAA